MLQRAREQVKNPGSPVIEIALGKVHSLQTSQVSPLSPCRFESQDEVEEHRQAGVLAEVRTAFESLKNTTPLRNGGQEKLQL